MRRDGKEPALLSARHSFATNDRERQSLVFVGAPLAIAPALAFLPLLAYLVLTPSIRHANLLAAVLFPLVALAEISGLHRLIRCCVTHPFDLLTVVASSCLLVVLLVATYTGLFLAVVAGQM